MKQEQSIFYCLLMVLFFSIFIGCGGGGGDTAVVPTPTTGTATLSWVAPITDEGGGALTGLTGYYVYYGTSHRIGSDPKICAMCGYTTKLNVGNVLTRIVNLSSGTYYFSVTAYDPSGNESVFSNEGTKIIP